VAAAVGLVAPLDKLSFWETKSDLFARFLDASCWLYVGFTTALVVVAGLFQRWVNVRMQLSMQHQPQGQQESDDEDEIDDPEVGRSLRSPSTDSDDSGIEKAGSDAPTRASTGMRIEQVPAFRNVFYIGFPLMVRTRKSVAAISNEAASPG